VEHHENNMFYFIFVRIRITVDMRTRSIQTRPAVFIADTCSSNTKLYGKPLSILVI